MSEESEEYEEQIDQNIVSKIAKSKVLSIDHYLIMLHIPEILRARANVVFQQISQYLPAYRKENKKRSLVFQCVVIAAKEIDMLIVPKRIINKLELTNTDVVNSIKTLTPNITNYDIPYRNYKPIDYMILFTNEMEWKKYYVKYVTDNFSDLEGSDNYPPQLIAAVALDIICKYANIEMKISVRDLTLEPQSIISKCRSTYTEKVLKIINSENDDGDEENIIFE